MVDPANHPELDANHDADGGPGRRILYPVLGDT